MMDKEDWLALACLVFGLAMLTGLFYLAIWMQDHWPWFIAGPIILFIAYNTSPYARYRRRR